MKTGKGWSTGEVESRIEDRGLRIEGRGSILYPLTSILIPFCALLTVAGCAGNSGHLEKKLMAEKPQLLRNQDYLVGFPDVLTIQVRGHAEMSGAAVIAPDGRIHLGQGSRLRVEGKSLSEVAAIVAGHAGLPTEAVTVKVKEYRSQPIFLIGQVVGWQRSVPYQGPETVLEVLQRVGGITPGAAVDDIYIVRAHVPDGPRPEVFHVDLKAILQKKDEKTNIRLLPYDQVYVGESSRAKLLKCLPPCLRPMFFPILGIRPIGPEGNGIRPKAQKPAHVNMYLPHKPSNLGAEK